MLLPSEWGLYWSGRGRGTIVNARDFVEKAAGQLALGFLITYIASYKKINTAVKKPFFSCVNRLAENSATASQRWRLALRNQK